MAEVASDQLTELVNLVLEMPFDIELHVKADGAFLVRNLVPLEQALA